MENQTSFFKNVIYLVVFALLLRLNGFFASFSYDEIWSLENFANLSVYDIFTQLKLPNNHPLNTLFIKAICNLNLNFFLIRLLPLLSGVGVVCLLAVIAKELLKSKYSILVVLIASLFNYPLICFSQVARGYQLQCFLLLVYSLSLIFAYKQSQLNNKNLPVKKNGNLLIFIGLALGSLGAIATLSTSAIYLTISTLAIWVYYNFTLPKKEFLLTIVCSAIIGIIYLGSNYLELTIAAQQWGVKVDNWAQIKLFAQNSITPLVSYCSLVLLLGCFFIKKREDTKSAILLLALIVIPFLTAFITNAGPARTYLPCVLSFILLLGFSVDLIFTKFTEKKNIVYLVLSITALTSLGDMFWQKRYWQFDDTIKIFNETKKLSKDIMVVYSASLSFPLAWNNSLDAFEDFSERLANGAELKELLMLDDDNKINGLDDNKSEATFKVSGPKATFDFFDRKKGLFYQLVPIEKNSLISKDETILVVLSCYDKVLYHETIATLKKIGTVLILNPWLNRENENGRILLSVKIKESFLENTLTSANSDVIIYLIKPKLGTIKNSNL